MDSTQSQHIVLHDKGGSRIFEQELIGEEPLLIKIEDQPYSVVMRTPGEEIFHVAGFCLGEGLVDDPDDFAMISHCSEMDSNVVSVRLEAERKKKVAALLERRGFISQTSCGICGKEMLKDLYQILEPVTDDIRIKTTQAVWCVEQLARHQNFYERTGASHGVMVFDSELNVLALAEDVGRHNALDKAVGKVFIGRRLAEARLAVLSSRVSYELVQKAARAGLPVLISISRPTALAVELGRNLNMTLVCAGNGSGVLVFCGEERLTRE